PLHYAFPLPSAALPPGPPLSLPPAPPNLLILLSFTFPPPPRPTLFPYTTLFRSETETPGELARQGGFAGSGRAANQNNWFGHACRACRSETSTSHTRRAPVEHFRAGKSSAVCSASKYSLTASCG